MVKAADRASSLVSTGPEMAGRLRGYDHELGTMRLVAPSTRTAIVSARPTFGQLAKSVVWEGVKAAGFTYIGGRVFGSPNLVAAVVISTSEAVAKKTVGAVITYIGMEETKGGKVAYVVSCFLITSVNIVALRIFGLANNTDVVKASVMALVKLGYNLHQVLRPKEHEDMLKSLPSIGKFLIEAFLKEQIEPLVQEEDGSKTILNGLVD